MSKPRLTIDEIAKLSGVSKGTVDRVLHQRGKVAEKSLQKILKVLSENEYKPNLLARSLSHKRKRVIAALIPNPAQDVYWENSYQGLLTAKNRYDSFGLTVQPFFFDVENKDSIFDIGKEILETNPDGLLTAPIFSHEAMPLLKMAEEKGIPFITYNNEAADTRPMTFIGVDLKASGKVGAEIIDRFQHEEGFLAVMHFYKEAEENAHLLEKEKGFREYFAGVDKEIQSFTFEAPKYPGVAEQLRSIFANPQLKGLFVTTSSTVPPLSNLILEAGRKDICFVGFDMVGDNEKYLMSGVLDALINQNPNRQAVLGIRLLANYILFNQLPERQYLFPIEIVTRQNMESFKNSDICFQ